jgi:hypothetical protein
MNPLSETLAVVSRKRNRRGRSPIANAAVAAVIALVASLPAAAQYGRPPFGSGGSGNPQISCAEAARALVQQETRWNERGNERGFANPNVLYWQAADGTQGTCQVDRTGRVYEVRVDRWGSPGGIIVWPGTDPGGSSRLLKCESEKGRRHECAIPRGARVRIYDRVSDAPCVQYRSWGTTRDQIWVDDGCRAIFEVTW